MVRHCDSFIYLVLYSHDTFLALAKKWHNKLTKNMVHIAANTKICEKVCRLNETTLK